MNQRPQLSPFDLAALAANAAESKKALDVQVMRIGTISSVADYFVVCTAESPIQVRAIADHIEATIERYGVRSLGRERDSSGKWYLLDFGDLVVHVMHSQAREFYTLERFWNHAETVSREQWLQEERQAS